MSIVFTTNALLRPPFSGNEFTRTKWESPDAKADFANKLCRFIAADFREAMFTKTLYRRLSLCFGHIAHYDSFGFLDHFFRDLRGKVAFLEETLLWPPCGDPGYTFCDVERDVQARLRTCNLLAAYRALRAAEVEGAERELLRRLQTKYGESPSAPEPTPIHTVRPPRQPRPPPAEQQTLF
ncbi:MAG: hypothetical protein BGO51_24310 [Rhodospirillales bacterium 69-11]|nr:hypothetical protein [Rhodospirillales bacterium]MBN8925926.1 hypothetical protein [Rhodospirillales bacterium]OJW30920.1 MAG: hypothetical protein BGO51_24310 [Rhodospirillales bacterium 69-11]